MTHRFFACTRTRPKELVHPKPTVTCLAILACLVSQPVAAGNGVREINDVCAMTTGCFAGDAPGYPVTIDGSAGHSYKLTGDLVIRSAQTTGISISASDVGIDLAGFSIASPACLAVPLNCEPASGTGFGITASTTTAISIAVFDGAIAGMGDDGLSLGDYSSLRNLRVVSNRRNGITTGAGSIIDDCKLSFNGNNGITTGSGSVVTNNAVTVSDGDGIFASSGSVVADNSLTGNERAGISTLLGAVIVGNVSVSNFVDGIFAGSGSLIADNFVFLNGDDGIAVTSGAGTGVLRNSANSNQGVGLNLFPNAGYHANQVVKSTVVGSTTVASGVNLGNNTCGGSATCP